MKTYFRPTILIVIVILVGFLANGFGCADSREPLTLEPNPEAQTQEAQTSSSPLSQTDVSKAQLDSLSPYQMRSFVIAHRNSQLTELWQRLGIRFQYAGERVSKHPDGFLNKCIGCEAEVFENELDDEPGREVLLRVSDNLQESCRYLVFKRVGNRSSDKWKFLGNIDHDFGRYRMPQHLVLLSGGTSWLAIEVQESSGNYFVSYSSRLFKVNNNGLRELLTFPTEGHQRGVSAEPHREFSSRLVSCDIKSGITTAEIEFSVSYSPDKLLWQKRQKAVFRGYSGKLSLDPRASDLTKEELEAVYKNPLSNEDLLKYNLDELKRIAEQGPNEDKVWLREFLKQCDNTREKMRLLDALR